jgi:hypothetical protein
VLLADDSSNTRFSSTRIAPAADGTFATGGTGVKNTGAIYVRNADRRLSSRRRGVYTNTLTGRDTRTDALEDARRAAPGDAKDRLGGIARRARRSISSTSAATAT